ncbi:MAG: ASKHA domain-containing protein, partial [Candidatus Bathyarchaeia archaeon]
PSIERVYQVGNTSLSLSRDLVMNSEMFDKLQAMAKDLRTTHVMLATSKIFEQVYVLEISYWRDGMPLSMYNDWLKSYGYHQLPDYAPNFQSTRLFKRDIPILGEKGLRVLRDIGVRLIGSFSGCIGCEKCVSVCPYGAVQIQENEVYTISVRTDKCDGMACLRCYRICPEKVFNFKDLTEIKIIH